MIGWGIIGVGDVTEVKANAAIFEVPGLSRLVHVMRRTPELARDYAVRHGVPRWSADAQAVIDDPEVDLVYVATPTSSHAEYTLAALAAGKHVLVEKPIAMDAAQAEAMVAAAEQAGRKLWVAYYRRTLPRFDRVRQVVATRGIGELLGVQVVWQKSGPLTGWRWDADLNRGGEFAETACHTLDLLDQLLGPATEASGRVSGGAASVAASWRQGGVPASGSWVFGAARDAEYCELIGSTGTLRFASFNPAAEIQLWRTGGSEPQVWSVVDPQQVHGPLVDSIIAELGGQGTCPSTGASALRTAKLVDAILG